MLRPYIVWLVFAFFVQPAQASEKINKSFFSGVALGGYDAVGYFTEGKAIPGSTDHIAEWKGAVWRFSSVENLRLFKTNPEAYAPQYGGHCSNQMSLGNLSDIDPKVWRLIKGKLYLFGHDSGRERWARETSQKILDADRHWQSYLDR